MQSWSEMYGFPRNDTRVSFISSFTVLNNCNEPWYYRMCVPKDFCRVFNIEDCPAEDELCNKDIGRCEKVHHRKQNLDLIVTWLYPTVT